MQITSILVVYAVVWFLTLFCVLPIRMTSQGEAGEIARGTTASAPSNPQMKKRFLITTVVAFLIWAPLCLAISYGYLTVDTINLYDWANPDS